MKREGRRLLRRVLAARYLARVKYGGQENELLFPLPLNVAKADVTWRKLTWVDIGLKSSL
jgi:hypothetical protein